MWYMFWGQVSERAHVLRERIPEDRKYWAVLKMVKPFLCLLKQPIENKGNISIIKLFRGSLGLPVVLDQ
jgi:hypothetical protein